MTSNFRSALSAVLSLLALFLAACLSNGEGGAGTAGSAVIANQISPASWAPLPGVDQIALSSEVIEARKRILGPDALDPNKVTFWWTGVTNFIVSMGGHIFLLDAWEIVGVHDNYSPVSRDDLVAIKPEAIFIGHAHFDHAGDMGFIAAQTGAVIVGSNSACETANRQAKDLGLTGEFKCLVVGTKKTPDPGFVQTIKIWEDLSPVTILHSLHSEGGEPEDLQEGGRPVVFVPDVLDYVTHLNTDPAEYMGVVRTAQDDLSTGDGEPTLGGTWAYHFGLKNFTFFWNDSAGAIQDEKPFGTAIQKVLRGLPGCTDVHLGSILGTSMFTRGFEDALLFVDAVQSEVFLPGHHDKYLPGIGGGAASFEAQWKGEYNTLKNKPELDYLSDPQDYMVPRSYSLDDPRWAKNIGGCAR